MWLKFYWFIQISPFAGPGWSKILNLSSIFNASQISLFSQILLFAGPEPSNILNLSKIFNVTQILLIYPRITPFAGPVWSKIFNLSKIFNATQISSFSQILRFAGMGCSKILNTYIHTRTFVKRLLTRRIQSAIGKGKTGGKKARAKEKRKPTNWEKVDV